MARTTQEEASNKAINRSRGNWAALKWTINSRDSVIADVRRLGGCRMEPSANLERLTWPERLKVVCVSLGFVLVLGFVGWLFWAFNSIPDSGWLGKEFWEPVGGWR